MCEECAPSLPAAILLGRSGFGDSFNSVEYAASENIQGIIFLGGSLICNYAAVCGGIMGLDYFVRDWSEM